jgi:uncharacterized protein YggE
MPAFRRLFAAAALVSLLASAPMAAHAAGDDALLKLTTLSISAEGEVKAAPDQATVSFGVQTQAKTAAEAMRQNRERMASSITALKAAGIEAKDIQTSALNLNGQYAYEPNQPPKLTGYQAVNQVTIMVRDLTKLGATVDAVTAAGSNQVNGIDFGLSNGKPFEDDARRAAVRTLAARAELYATAAGMKLGRLINLSEGGGYQPAPLRRVGFADAQMKSAAVNTPVEPGQLTVRIEISATYELTK